MSIRNDAGRPGQAAPQMLQLLNSYLTVQALHVAAALGLADRLADGPATVDDLATACGAHRPSLYRLLRMLSGAGVFREEADGRFTLTPLGGTLRSEGPDSVRDWALYVGAPDPWEAWSRLRDTVMTGEPGFVLAHGMSVWEHRARHPELGAAFDRWMSRQSDQHNAAVVAGYDFSPFRTVADIGGGQGSTRAAILRTNPSLRGILLDRPQVVARPAPLEAAGVADRCQVIGGDMLQGVPGGGDAYLIKRVLMDWGDETGWGVIVDYDYEPHIRLIRDLRPPGRKRYKPRRWVVERTLSWLSKCRAILIRWDKKACNYLGLLKLACALLWFRRLRRVAGAAI